MGEEVNVSDNESDNSDFDTSVDSNACLLVVPNKDKFFFFFFYL